MVAMAMPRYMNSANGLFPLGIIFKEPEDNTLVFPAEALPWRSGYLNVKSSSKTRMFYAFYEAIEPNMAIAQTPIILWLQGGPGCSSMTGNFYELGPWRISLDQKLDRNHASWNRKFGVLFIDSPVGSGYSIAEKDEDIPTDENQVAEHLYTALEGFYSSVPEFSNRLLFVAGESYAGKYVPALGHCILMKSKNNSMGNAELGSLVYGGSKLPFRLGGLLIGNGLTDPEIQVQTHANVAYNFGLIDRNQKTQVGELAERVLGFIHKEEWFEAYKARTALLDWIQNVSGIATPLDVRRSVPYHCSPDGKDFLAPFLNRKSVKGALNAELGVEWVPCNSRVRRIMENDIMKSAKWKVEKVLEEVPVLLYQGHYDIQDGVVSNTEWMRTMSWYGTSEFFNTERSIWVVDDKVAGHWRSYKNLTHVVFLGAGHEVAADQGLHSQKMVEKWIADQLSSCRFSE